jgi:malate synthase
MSRKNGRTTISKQHLLGEGLEISAPVSPAFSDILTRDALAFVARLSRNFSGTREELVSSRILRQKEIDLGTMPDFPPETESIRTGHWTISPVPADLQDRRVEITGPSGDTKMVINALNSGASVYMSDFEDSQSPTWQETIQGQINLKSAIEGSIAYKSPEGKVYSLNDRVATLIVRPRGWHLQEKHVLVDGSPMPAALFDFGMFFFHNAKTLLKKGTGPYFYLPKLESHLEARLWNDVFLMSETELNIPRGAIKATVLIETILAAFEMDEILYELREHSSGLNCGRWDYIFSFIKKFRNYPRFTLPDRAQVTMDKAFLSTYVDLLIKTCHRRRAHAIGGMSAYIPVKGNDELNKAAMEKVRQDKEREARLGHDGTWVAHPGLVPLAKEVFDRYMPGPNQLHVLREDVNPVATDLFRIPEGEITENGLRTNVRVGIQYLESWLRGKGCVPLYNLMEDAATAEICRAQLWQWARHHAVMKGGRSVSTGVVQMMIDEETAKLLSNLGGTYQLGQYGNAKTLLHQMVAADQFPEFLTTVAYEKLLTLERTAEDSK